MSYSRKAYESSLKAHKKLIATKLLDGIEKLYENKISERRWIWELLQNAKDVAEHQVEVQIVLKADSVEFQHNGNPFLMDNVTYLIEQVSTKDRASELGEALETTGKFGTGFMTTHLLSKKVEVKGVLEDQDTQPAIYKRFSLKLDRDAATPDEMIAKVDESYKVFEALDNEALCPGLTNYEPCKHFDTSFKYDLDQKGLSIAEIGIGDLYNALSYALIFIPKIKSVIVVDEIKETKVKYSVVFEQNVGSNIKVSTIQIEADADVSSIKIASIANLKQTITLAIPLQAQAEQLSIKAFHLETPKLFCDFPLVGSEQFSFPVVFNSPLFNPSEPRDTVLLDERDDEKRQFNKALFEDCLKLYDSLVDYASVHWQDAYLLAKSAMPARVDRQWYKHSIQRSLRKKVLATPIVDTCNNERIPLAQARIPYHTASVQVVNLWKLAIAFHRDCLPIENHVLGWYDIVDTDWEKDFRIKLRYTLTDLVQDIANEVCLSQLAQRIKKSEAEALGWLNQVIAFIEVDSSAKSDGLLNTYPIIPNQYGNFQVLSKLRKDLNIPEQIKYVLKILGEDWKQQLSHLGIQCRFSTSLDIKKASSKIDEKLRENAHSDLRKAVYYLISCYPAKDVLQQPPFQLRTQIWQLAKSLDGAVPEPQFLSDWTPRLWTECDAWLLKTLVRDLVKIGNLQNLQTALEKTSEDEAAAWLSNFVGFLNRNSTWKLFYVEEKVLPNQRGLFLSKDYISFDKGIPDEIKDVLEKIDIDYRSELLDVRIKGFENYPQKLGVSDASSEIDKRLIEKDSLDDPKLREVVFSLISYFTAEEDITRKDIWKLANTFYGDSVVADIQVIPNLAEFNWDQCNRWALEWLSREVAAENSLEQLAQCLKTNQDEAIQYLDKLIPFASQQGLSIFLEKLKIWPNQHGYFCEKKALKKDGGIDSELKEICNYLTKQDWRSTLVLSHSDFINTLSLFSDTETELPEAIAKEIDEALKAYKGDRRDHNFVEAVRLLFVWSKLPSNTTLVKELLPYFHKNKAQLFLDICEDQGIHSCVFDLMQQGPEKLEALARLANSPDISQSDINQFVEHHADFKTLEALRTKRDDPDSTSEVLQLLEDLGLDPDYLNTLLSDYASQSEPVAVGLEKRLHCSSRRVRTYPQVISFEDSHDTDDVGLRGEEFVHHKLVAKFGSDRVQWMNEDKEERFPYDFKVLEEDLKEVAYYIDAKSSRKGEHGDGSIFFSITNAQWDFLKECDNYYIAKVFRALSERPNLQLIKIDLRDELL
ncbi:MAG: DUF3883 domain-containing protein [Phormidesmis sp.]